MQWVCLWIFSCVVDTPLLSQVFTVILVIFYNQLAFNCICSLSCQPAPIQPHKISSHKYQGQPRISSPPSSKLILVSFISKFKVRLLTLAYTKSSIFQFIWSTLMRAWCFEILVDRENMAFILFSIHNRLICCLTVENANFGM